MFLPAQFQRLHCNSTFIPELKMTFPKVSLFVPDFQLTEIIANTGWKASLHSNDVFHLYFAWFCLEIAPKFVQYTNQIGQTDHDPFLIMPKRFLLFLATTFHWWFLKLVNILHSSMYSHSTNISWSPMGCESLGQHDSCIPIATVITQSFGRESLT